MPRDYKPVQFKQLCAIAKMLLQRDPMIDDAEWKASTRDHLQKLGFDEPDPEMLTHAMTQVEQALKQTIGPRHVGQPVLPQANVNSSAPYQETRTNRPAGWEIVMRLMRRLGRVSPDSASTSPRPSARALIGITEITALNEFWRQVRLDVDKIALLRAYAEVAILRPDTWRPDAIRAEFRELRFAASGCFVCLFDKTAQHHIIQIQHGGSNYARNLIALCERCHATVHPWLVDAPQDLREWTQLSDIRVPRVCPDREIA